MHRQLESARRIDQLLSAASAEERDDLGRRTSALACERGLWREVAGSKQALPFALSPWVLTEAERKRVSALGWQARLALTRLSRLADRVPDFHAVVPLAPREREWFERDRRMAREQRRPERVFCRLDALLERGEGSELRVRWLEPNVVGIAGMTYAPALEDAICEVLLPWLRQREPSLSLARADEGRRMLFDELCEHAAQLGVSDRLPIVALVDDLSQYTLGGELARVQAHFEALGMRTALIGPEQLEAASAGRLMAGDLAIDVVYRFLELSELIAMEEAGHDLSGMRRAFEQGRVVPSMGGDLEHKSVLELLSRRDFLSTFPRALRQALAGSVLWTRLLHERRTDDPDGQPCDLAPFCEQHRERLVLKPNRGFGGAGIVIGPMVDQAAWSDALSAALSQPDGFVVQEYTAVDREELTVFDGAGAQRATYHRSAAVFPGRGRVCLFGRYSRDPVVNITRGGGVIAFMLEPS